MKKINTTSIQMKPPGFGIGLFIVREIIYQHNRTIEMMSEKGAEFNINLPLACSK